MFDTIMRNTMAVWMPLSALYPVFVGLFIYRALAQMRRLRALRREAGARLRSEASAEAEDWVPSP